jgi:NADPH-dependent 2,4-dienoyl-CoA reductase/sulfur reductase-like enzyme/rhodanese-related sulfurtransferase
MKLVIVGGVAGGASAAARARRVSEDAEIVLVERGRYVSFANCGLPYYIGDEIKQREKLIVTTPQRLRDRFRVDVRTQTNAIEILRSEKKIKLQNQDTGEIVLESYDKLILSPGANPLRPVFPGHDLPNVYTLRTLEDVDRIRALVDSGIRSAVVVGAGFIGLEVVENLVHRGVKTSLVQLMDQVLGTMDKEMTTPIERQIRERGVQLFLGTTANRIERVGEGKLKVYLDNGTEIVTDMVLLGIGVRPENQLAVQASLEVGPRGGIVTNAFMQTSDQDIYAVGDAVEVEDFVLKSRAQVALAGPANRQGRIAADHALGRSLRYRGTQGTAIVRAFACVAASTGATERTLTRSNIAYEKIYLHPSHHAGYYPGAQGMSIKLLFAPETGKLLGAQITGGEGVDKRIDVLAMAIQAEMNVFDLEEVELAYAPQFGSAKDPINMAGFIASGVLRGDHPVAHWSQVISNPDAIVVDVRDPAEFSAGHYPGAIPLPVDHLRCSLDRLPKDKPIYVYCQVGQRGYIATRILLQHGFAVKNLSGGYKAYQLVAPNAC